MEDGEEAPKGPERPKLGPRPLSPQESQAESQTESEPESYGRAYYTMNTAQKLASSKPDRDNVSLPKARGGWTFFILVAAIGLYIYWKPSTVTSAFTNMKEWVLNQREQIFTEGGGYGELPKDGR